MKDSGTKTGHLFLQRDAAMTDDLTRKWHDLLGGWHVSPQLAEELFSDVCKHYGEPGRFYHTLDHVSAVLETVESLNCHARNLRAIKLAAWLHDVIYDSRTSDNEERCADYAERLCEHVSIPEGRLVASLILKTKTHDAGGDPDAQVLIDADLAVGTHEIAWDLSDDNGARLLPGIYRVVLVAGDEALCGDVEIE